MFGSTIIYLFLVTLSFTQLHYGTAENFNKGVIFTGKKTFDNGNFVYAICDKLAPSKTQCTVVQKLYPKKESTRSCLITLKAGNDQSVIAISIGVSTLGRGKAILFWEDFYNDTTTTTISTLNLETCKMNEVKIPDNNRNVISDVWSIEKLVAYDDSFDVLIRDSERFGRMYGKMTINGDGAARGEPVVTNFKSNGLYQYLGTIANRSSSKGYAFLRAEYNALLLGIVKPDGSEKQLAEYASSAGLVVTASDNFVSSCNETNTDVGIDCTQYNDKGRVIFWTIIMEKNSILKAIHNLPGGGMLVLLAEQKQCEDRLPNCNEEETKHRMVKIAFNGKVVGSVGIKEFGSVSTWKPMDVYVNGDFEYCAVLIGDHPTTFDKMPTKLEIRNRCVKDIEFSPNM